MPKAKSDLTLLLESRGVTRSTYLKRIKAGYSYEEATSGKRLSRRAKLTEEDVRHIHALILERERLLAKAGALSFHKIADKFGICRQMVSAIALGKAHHKIY